MEHIQLKKQSIQQQTEYTIMFLRQFYQVDGAPETLDNYDNNISIADVPVNYEGTVEDDAHDIDPIRTLTDASIKL